MFRSCHKFTVTLLIFYAVTQATLKQFDAAEAAAAKKAKLPVTAKTAYVHSPAQASPAATAKQRSADKKVSSFYYAIAAL
jgi:uncharacterized protein (DUF2267 family)